MTRRLFVTTITEKNGNIDRWGNVVPCVTDPFQEAPLFIESMKYVLICLFGTEFYDILSHEIKSRKKPGGQYNANDFQGWGYLCDRSSEERKEILAIYAERYIVPMFEQYPELVGKVYLALRKEGFLLIRPLYII
ncbi:MAG: hypothetical protein QME46_02800 [Thermoanaerobacteraceae bacterium]|nr:hypothetical protein [Thermoanaerobacteraceae bacterium]